MEKCHENEVLAERQWDLASWTKNCRQQMGLQDKNRIRWSYTKVQSKVGGSRIHSEVHYDETFCPVIRQESLCVLMALSAQHGLQLHQMDVFLNGTLEEEVFMRQPQVYEVKGKEQLVCRLKKSICGLKQSPRCWNIALDSHLKEMGFSQSQNDPCIYYKDADGEIFYMGVYVDDIILAGTSESKLKEVKTNLSRKFDTKDLGKLSYFMCGM